MATQKGVRMQDHLIIHKEQHIDGNRVCNYLVNTYYDYALTFYFETRKQAEQFVLERKLIDKLLEEERKKCHFTVFV